MPIVGRRGARSTSSNSSPVAGPLLLLAEHHIRTGDGDKVGPLLDAFLQGRQAYYAQYGGDYGIYQQKQELRQIVTSSRRRRTCGSTLDYLGRFEDVPVTRNYGDITLTTPALILGPAAGPGAARRSGTRPGGTGLCQPRKRRTIRFLDRLLHGDITPAIFRLESQRDLRRPAPDRPRLEHRPLVDVGRAGERKLSRSSSQLVEPLVAEKLPRAETAADGDPGPGRGLSEAAAPLEAVLARVNERIKGTTTPADASNNAANAPPTPRRSRRSPTTRWDEFLLVERVSPHRRIPGRAAARAAGPRRSPQRAGPQPRSRTPSRLLAIDAIRDFSEADARRPPGRDSAHWMTAAVRTAGSGSGVPPSWWSVHDGVILPLCNSEFARRPLHRRSPPEGTFEFSFERIRRARQKPAVRLRGLVCQPPALVEPGPHESSPGRRNELGVAGSADRRRQLCRPLPGPGSAQRVRYLRQRASRLRRPRTEPHVSLAPAGSARPQPRAAARSRGSPASRKSPRSPVSSRKPH